MDAAIIRGLEECEGRSRELVRQGMLRELEPYMREWDRLLGEARRSGDDSLDLHYFTMVFEQINGALYQSVGQPGPMRESLLKGKQAADRCAALLMRAEAEDTDDRGLHMGLNCAEYLSNAGGILEASDMETAFAMAGKAAEIYDWLWPVLLPDKAVRAAETQMKLFALYFVAGRQDQGQSCADKAAKRYEELFDRTRDMHYQLESWKTRILAIIRDVSRIHQETETLSGYLERLERMEREYAPETDGGLCAHIVTVEVMALAALGTDAFQNGDGERAERLLIRCCEKTEDALKILEQYPQSAESFDRDQVMNAYISGSMMLGAYYNQTGRYQEGESCYLRVLKNLDENPQSVEAFMGQLARVQIYTELGQMTEGDPQGTKRDFYLTQAADLSLDMIANNPSPQALRAAALSLLGAAEMKSAKGKAAEAARYAGKGLELCSVLERTPGHGFSGNDLKELRRFFDKYASQKKGGFFSRLLGR